MVIDWEDVAIRSGKLVLFFLEYCFKLFAVLVTMVTLSSPGSLGSKLGNGFASLSLSLQKLFAAPGELSSMAHMVYQYNTLSSTAFNEQFGPDAVSSLLTYLHGGVIYIHTVSQNFTSQPFTTFFAALIAFLSIYVISLVLRFARQKGQGSFINKLERKLGEKVFYEPNTRLKERSIKKAEPPASPELQPQKERSNKPGRSFGQANSENKYLQEYMKVAQKEGK